MHDMEKQGAEIACAICGSKLVPKKIGYVDLSEDHFLIVRDVPVQECEENGHLFFHSTVARQDEGGYIAECLNLAVVTQGQSLDETVRNLREANQLHLEDEDFSD